MCDLLDDLFEYRDLYTLIKCSGQEDKYFHHMVELVVKALDKHGSEKVVMLLAKYKQAFENFLTVTLPKQLLFCISGKSEFDSYDSAVSLINMFDSFVNEPLSQTFHGAVFCAASYCEEIVKNRSKSLSNETKEHTVVKSLKATLVSQMANLKLYNGKGQKDFRSLSVVPTAKDLSQETPGLKPRIINGDYDSIEDYLDLNFRLFREDMLYGLRKGLGEYKARVSQEKKKIFSDLEHVRAYSSRLKTTALYGDSGKIYTYEVKMVQTVDFETTKRMKPGNILCLSKNDFQTVVFVSIIYRDPKKGEGNTCTITTRVEAENEELIEDIEMMQDFIILEPENYFESYRHILSNMKILCEDNFPFQNYLVKPCAGLSNSPHIPSFGENITEQDIDKFVHSENLDVTQKDAVRLALKSPVSLIQGPPGTGKTYTGLKMVKFLLSHHVRPVLIMCYTNHALDKFLEGIFPFSKRIIRVGSQSESVLLKPNVLSNIQKAMRCFMFDGNKVKNCSKSAEALEYKESLNIAMDLMPGGFPFNKWGLLKTLVLKHNKEAMNEKLQLWNLAQENPFHREVLNLMLKEVFKSALMAGQSSSDIVFCVREWLNVTGQDEEEFKSEIKYLTSIVSNEGSPHSGLVNRHVTHVDPWDLPLPERKLRYCLYRSRFLKELEEQMEFLEEFFNVLMKHMHKEEIDYKHQILKNAEVIGLTTTGAAKNRELLDLLKPEIVLVEEAAEVDELHVVASIPSSVKQLILIGDHKQLTPMPACEHLSENFNLNKSLFERLFCNRIPHVVLETQRRMRPTICELLVPVFYKSLANHLIVNLYEDIRGMKSNIFFISHEEPEVESYVEKTHWNLYEAKFIAALVHYLVKQQNYKYREITVLTMYSGQQKILSKLFELKELSDVLVSTVDGFQGEECNIVIVSFVRSNERDEIGFLKSGNRVCVALSRAMGGLYCIGNFELYAKKDVLWYNLVEKLKTKQEFGQKLPVKDKNGKICNISSARDFVGTCISAKFIDFYRTLDLVTLKDLTEDK